MPEITLKDLNRAQKWSEHRERFVEFRKRAIAADGLAHCRDDAWKYMEMGVSVSFGPEKHSHGANVHIRFDKTHLKRGRGLVTAFQIECPIGFFTSEFTVARAVGHVAVIQRAIEFAAMVEGEFGGYVYIDDTEDEE